VKYTVLLGFIGRSMFKAPSRQADETPDAMRRTRTAPGFVQPSEFVADPG